jgi:hypothetical protein
MKNLGRLIAKTNIGNNKRGFKPPMKSESFLNKMFQEGGKKASYNLRADDTTLAANSGSTDSEDDPPPGSGDSIDWVVEPSLYTSDEKDDETRYLPEETEDAPGTEDSELDYMASVPYGLGQDTTAMSAEGYDSTDEAVLLYDSMQRAMKDIHFRRIVFETAPSDYDLFRPRNAALTMSQDVDILAKKITDVEGL